MNGYDGVSLKEKNEKKKKQIKKTPSYFQMFLNDRIVIKKGGK